MADNSYPALMDPQTMGILAAAFQGLQSSGPSRMPMSFGQIAGQAGSAGLQQYNVASESSRRNAQTEALIKLEQQKAAQTGLTMEMQLGQINYGREQMGLPPISLGGMGGQQAAQAGGGAVPMPSPSVPGGAVQMPGMTPPAQTVPMPGPQMSGSAPVPMQSKFQQATAHLPPGAVEEAKVALLKGDATAYAKILATGHLQNVQGIGLLQWDPKTQGYTLPQSQEEALAARTRAGEQAKQDVADAGKPATFTFGSGMSRRPVETTQAVANALRTGEAPDERTATQAGALATQMGYGVQIGVRQAGKSGDERGLLGYGEQIKGGGSLPSGAQPTPDEAAREAANAKFRSGRAESAVTYERAINEKVGQGQALDARLNEMSKLTQEFKGGGGAEVRARLAELAQAVPGVSQKMVDGIANGNLGSIQEFEKLQIQGAMEALRVAMTNSAGAGAGRITQAEFQIFLKANPNIKLDPRGLEKILDFQKWTIAVDKAEQQGFSSYIKDPKNDPADYPSYFADNRDKILKENGIETPDKAAKSWNKPTGKTEKTFSLSDLQSTAMKYKITVDEARKKLEDAGWRQQ